MWSVINRSVSLRKLDRKLIARCSSTNDSYGLDKIKPLPVPDIVRKPRRLPFLKSIYAGQYDIEVLTYPETLNLERFKDLESRVQQVQHNCTKIDTVRQLGLFGMSAPYPSSGLNLSDTEIARVSEHFDSNTFKCVFDHTLCVDIIKTFGTPSQKSKYLPLLASGAVCTLHVDTVTSTLLPNESWELTGSVKNSADVFLLFVIGSKAYIVEKDKTFVNGENLELRHVVVASDDVMENVNLTKIIQRGKLYTCSLLTTLLKRVVQATVQNLIPKTRLSLKLRECDSVLKIISKSLINIYTLESMIYLTTWMTDGFDDPDIELESASIQLFARQTVDSILIDLKMVNGRSSINQNFSTLCNEVEDLVESLEGSMKLANFISSRGVEFFNKSDYEENVSFLTTAYRNIMMKRNEPSLKYGLQQFLHPALKHAANFLEYDVLKFQFIINQCHAAGQLSTDNQMLMERLSTVIIYIYAMTAVLGRASRSYCTGIRFCDYEMNTGETVVRESCTLLKPIIEELMSGKYVATDSVYESLADQLLFNNINRGQTET
ncbi:acyl-CoA dehydrogenase family member 9, mitochondrial [Acyrthosiphon pisum]|uniref:Acyl-CoA dehydrogenase family member 9, mitochondrial n=1 Tax=Acyrthosiphon pisum TaxID=7029 RepID=A0A8R2B4P9_ACYPI|nr:acyl-CoA dehydrogenase family member 9, mitochondrial [Acyrthosiphon pisum]|eukprot:XP_008181565.1 PREDICTED: acyl-CoA dehydrogenase family member 9, mitochondrial [Acyrthosiphon pisum]